MKSKKQKKSQSKQKSPDSKEPDLETNEMFIEMKNHVNSLNSNNNIYRFDVQLLYNGRFFDKENQDSSKNKDNEDAPFLEESKTSEASQDGQKLEVILGIGFDKLKTCIECLRVEEDEIKEIQFFHSIFSVIPKFNTISKLRLIDCDLNAKSIETIAKQLKSDNNTIRDLHLDLNVVPEQNYYLLIDETTLKHLSLRHCGIDCKGAKLIASALKYKVPGVRQHLLSLVLNGNGIGDSGVYFFAMALRTNFKLHYLSLAHNLITDSGIEMIAGILKNFPISPEEDTERRFMFIKYMENAASIHGEECLDPIHEAIQNYSLLSCNENEKSFIKSESDGNEKSFIRSESNGNKKSSIKSENNGNKKSSIKSENNEKADEEIKLEEEQPKASNSFISLTNIVNGDLHPLLTTVYKEGDLKYCVGNFSLAFMNLSYNYFGRIGLRALIKAIEYQKNVGPQINGLGLMGVKVVGLKRKEDLEEEIEKLNLILSERHIPQTYDRRHLINSSKNLKHVN